MCFHEVRFSILHGINFFRFFRNPQHSRRCDIMYLSQIPDFSCACH